MKYIPLANLKNTTGIVAFCKDAKEIVIANRNGLPKLVLMSREDTGFLSRICWLRQDKRKTEAFCSCLFCVFHAKIKKLNT